MQVGKSQMCLTSQLQSVGRSHVPLPAYQPNIRC